MKVSITSIKNLGHKLIFIFTNHWKVILFICFAFLFVWDCLTSSPYESLTFNPLNVDWKSFSLTNIDVNAVIQSLVSALLGVLFTIIIIEKMLNKQKEKEEEKRKHDEEEKAKERKKWIVNYILTAFSYPFANVNKVIICSLYPLNELNGKDGIPKNVTPNMLVNVYNKNILSDETFYTKNIDLLILYLDELKQWLKDLILNPSIADVPELYKILINYYKIVVLDNPCKQIKKYESINFGKEKAIDSIRRELPEYEYVKGQEGHYLYPFQKLKELIDCHRNFIEQLKVSWNELNNQ